MTNTQQGAGLKAADSPRVVDLSQPAIVQQDGRPIMVALSYEEYLHLKHLSGNQSASAQ